MELRLHLRESLTLKTSRLLSNLYLMTVPCENQSEFGGCNFADKKSGEEWKSLEKWKVRTESVLNSER